jgi:hypothetical protein
VLHTVGAKLGAGVFEESFPVSVHGNLPGVKSVLNSSQSLSECQPCKRW